MAKFFIHAAGYHSDGLSDNVLDLAISFYSSSIKTLIHGRRHRPQITKTSQSEDIILVAMPKTSKKGNLQFATNEIDELTNFCNFMNLQIKKPSPFKKAVLSALNSCKIFHFADHGFIDDLDPFKSHLLLKDWETKSLTIAKLFEKNLRKQMPFFVYFSTCGTGQIKHDEFIDESLHLISACQLAGFQHVVDTL